MAPSPGARRINLKWYIVAVGTIFAVFLGYSSFHQSVFRVEACVDFRGRRHCAEASGRTRADAVRSAQEIDCELVANGRDENMACLDEQPSSVRFLSAR